MVAAAQHDPVAAVLMHSSPADIGTVIVDGIVRKEGGRLVGVRVDEGAREVVGREGLEWGDVAREILKSREIMQEELEKVDIKEAVGTLMGMWGVPEGMVVNVE